MPANKKGGVRYKLLTLGLADVQMIGEASDRKSWMILNTDSANTVRISNTRSGTNVNEYMEIPPNSSITCKIPEDNPRLPVYGDATGSSTVILIYEAYAK